MATAPMELNNKSGFLVFCLSVFLTTNVPTTNGDTVGDISNETTQACRSRHENRCYQFLRSMQYTEAAESCRKDGYQMAIVENPEQEDSLLQAMNESNFRSIMLGSIPTKPTLWKWTDGNFLQDQGCYSSAQWSRSLARMNNEPGMTVEKCRPSCDPLEQHIIAIMGSTGCYCGHKYEPKKYASCTDETALHIFPKQSLSDQSNWDEGYPMGEFESRNCLSADVSGKWRNEDCRLEKRFVCMDNSGNCSISNEAMNWFEARYHCESDGHRLVESRNAETMKALKDALADIVATTDERFWLGATNTDWTWSDGRPIIYTNWLPGEPKLLLQRNVISLVQKSPILTGWGMTFPKLPGRSACQYDLPEQNTTTEPTTEYVPLRTQEPELSTINITEMPTTNMTDNGMTTTHMTDNGMTTTHMIDNGMTTTHMIDNGMNGEEKSVSASLKTPNMYIGFGLATLAILIVITLLLFIIYKRRSKLSHNTTENVGAFDFENKVYFNKAYEEVQAQTNQTNHGNYDDNATYAVPPEPRPIGSMKEGNQYNSSDTAYDLARPQRTTEPPEYTDYAYPSLGEMERSPEEENHYDYVTTK